jgi:hypothetical protein
MVEQAVWNTPQDHIERRSCLLWSIHHVVSLQEESGERIGCNLGSGKCCMIQLDGFSQHPAFCGNRYSCSGAWKLGPPVE